MAVFGVYLAVRRHVNSLQQSIIFFVILADTHDLQRGP